MRRSRSEYDPRRSDCPGNPNWRAAGRFVEYPRGTRGSTSGEGWDWFQDHGGHERLVTLSASGEPESGTYESQAGMNPATGMYQWESVISLVIRDRKNAESPMVARIVENATALFVEGGDQTRYVEYSAGTALQTAMASHVNVHPIGGTSAGMHLMSSTVYTPPLNRDGVASDEALANPNSPNIAFSGDFYGIGLFGGTVFDTHFRERDRMGRSLAFLAQSSASRAIMADEGTALLVEMDQDDPHYKHGRVVGGGAVYFARNDNAPSVAAPNKLTLGPTRIDRIRKNDLMWQEYFDFAEWARGTTAGITYELPVINGQITANYPNGQTSSTNYYGIGNQQYSNM